MGSKSLFCITPSEAQGTQQGGGGERESKAGEGQCKKMSSGHAMASPS